MSQISKYPISKEVAERIFDVFAKTLIALKDKPEVESYIGDLFTPTEKIMFSKRIAIAFLLSKGYQYREISTILKVSLTTIGSVSLSLKYGKGGYDRIIKRIAKEEKLEDFFKSIVEKLLSVPAASGKGGSTWRYLNKEVKKSRKNRVF